jgi:serine/threonine-protein kinase
VSSAARPLPVSTPAFENLDDHQVLARIGRGGMAEIFLARRPAHETTELVVLKRLLPEDDEDPGILRMFLDEARLALRLTHPSIVRALGIGMLEERHALVLEFLEGQTLQSVLRRASETGRRMPLEVLVPLFADVLEGLHYAHDLVDDTGRPLGVVHRDVSPHNIFVTSAGSVKLLDFGIAKTEMQEHRTRTGLLKGKVAYMAPEQALGARVDRRADIWSLGVTFWEAITGTRLFKADNEAASLRMTLSGPIAKPSSARSEIPSEIDRITLRALKREPAQRYATAGAMAEELRGWAERHRLPMIAPAREFMAELFERDVAEQRARISALLSNPESVPVSSSVPALIKHLPSPETGGASHVSTVTEFLGQLQERQRNGFRRIAVLLAVLSAGVLALGFTLFARGGTELEPPLPAAAHLVAQAANAPVPVPTPPITTAAASPAPDQGSSAEATTPSAARPEDATPRRRSTRSASRESAGSALAPEGVADAPQPTPAQQPQRSDPRPPAPAHADVEFGFLTLDTSPWSQVTADGVSLGQTPIVRAKLSAGPHTLVLVNSERGLSTTYQVTIEAGKTTVRRLGLD